MKRILSAVLVLVLLFSYNSIGLSSSQPLGSSTRQMTVDGLGKTVNVVTVDLNNPNVELGVVISNDVIGGNEDFISMVQRNNMIAAINANFFDAYTALEPYGTIMKDGRLLYLEGQNASMAVSNGNGVSFDRFQATIKGYLDGQRDNFWNNSTQSMDFYLFDVWYVNNLPKDKGGVYIYTPERGQEITLEGGVVIEVVNNKVSKVIKNAQRASIPQNGYLIYYGSLVGGSKEAAEAYVDARFKIGRAVELEIESFYKSDSPMISESAEDIPQAPTEPIKLYGCVDKITENFWDVKKNDMSFNTFNAWYVNNMPIDSSGVYLYTPERGASLSVPKGIAVVVAKGKVINMLYNADKFDIPRDGFVIYYGKDAANENYVNQRFSLGKTVDFYHPDSLKIDTEAIIKDVVKKNTIALYQQPTSEITTSKIDLNKIEHLISAGPYLIREGKIVVNAEAEGFAEDKITKGRAQRSAIGVTKDNQLLMITVANTNMNELAQIMNELGAVEAINLDGGASSGLYANGRVITVPGRKLSTVLAVYDKTKENDQQRQQQIARMENRIKSGEFKNINDVKKIGNEIFEYTINKFSDVNNNDWYGRNVSYLVGLNIIAGYSDGTFRPNDPINVDAFTKMIVTALNLPVKGASGYWAQPLIDKAIEVGIIKKGEFSQYDRPITRGEMARMIVRAMDESPSQDLSSYIWAIKDYEDIDRDLRESVLLAYSTGIMTGIGNGSFAACSNANRASAATMILRLIDKSSRVVPAR